jgi:hypothetical protein
MTRLITAAVVAVLALPLGCTLLLPTDEIIQACAVQDECPEGFICDQNACLPEDVIDDVEEEEDEEEEEEE